MADISKIKINNVLYDINDETARAGLTTSATASNEGVITFKNSSNTALYSIQLPLYDETSVDDGSTLYEPKVRLVSITLSTSWTLNNGVYNQVITIPALGEDTLNKKIDLISTQELVNQLVSDNVSMLFINNNDGVFTAVAVGGQPSAQLVAQAAVTEVSA